MKARENMKYDKDEVDQATLALMWLVTESDKPNLSLFQKKPLSCLKGYSGAFSASLVNITKNHEWPGSGFAFV